MISAASLRRCGRRKQLLATRKNGTETQSNAHCISPSSFLEEDPEYPGYPEHPSLPTGIGIGDVTRETRGLDERYSMTGKV